MLKEIDGYGSNTVEQDVFIAESREETKKYLKEKFGDIPLLFLQKYHTEKKILEPYRGGKGVIF